MIGEVFLQQSIRGEFRTSENEARRVCYLKDGGLEQSATHANQRFKLISKQRNKESSEILTSRLNFYQL